MEELKVDEMIEVCGKTFKEAEKMLLTAENILFEKLKMVPGQKSEIRQRLEKFEEDIGEAWKRECERYNTKQGFVWDLPENVYKRVCEEYIQRRGQEIFYWLIYRAGNWNNKTNFRCPPLDNPYILAVCALQMGYNIFGKEEEVGG